MFQRLRKKDWKDSPAHLLLLSNFLRGSSPADYRDAEYWETVLKEKPAKAIDRFIKEGMLKLASLSDHLEHKFKAAELKAMLKSKALKTSGRKEELIYRLIENDRQGMEDAARGLDIYRATSEGAKLAQEYVDEDRRKRDDAERDALDLLSRGTFSQAARAVARYEASRVFPRGTVTSGGVVPPSRDDELRWTRELETIFNRTPRILAGVDESRLAQLRLGAGMMMLWGTGRAKRWVPDDFETGIHLDVDAACRMLVFYARNLWQMEGAMSAGCETVEIMGHDDEKTCAECRKLSGKRFKADEAPVLPYAKCTCELGCRCNYMPMMAEL